jgi:hypothetical protein
VNQCEVSYFNNIPVQEEETYLHAFERVFAWPVLDRFGARLAGHCLTPEAGSFTLGMRVTDNESAQPRARLIATAQPAVQDTGNRIIRLTMVFRGPPLAGDRATLTDFLMLGREAIVKTFADITSKECHALWEREA